MGGYDEQIESYLRDKLPEKESAELRAKEKSDPAFRKEVNRHRLMELAMDQLAEQGLRAHLGGEAREPSRAAPPSARRRWVLPVSIAAGIALIFFAGLYALSLATYSGSGIAQDLYLPPVSGIDRSGSGTPDPLYMSGLQAYYDRELDVAIQQFRQVPESSSQYIAARFMLAHALFQDNDYAEAATQFGWLEGNPELPGNIDRSEMRVNRLLSRFAEENRLPADSLTVLGDLLEASYPGGREILEKTLNSPLRKLVD